MLNKYILASIAIVIYYSCQLQVVILEGDVDGNL